MAKNWTAAEAIEAIRNGDRAAISDIGKRFPLFAHYAACDAVQLIMALPEFITARKIESVLKGDIADANEDASENDVEDKEEEKPVKKAKKPAVVEEEDDDEEEEKPAKKSKKAKAERSAKKSKKKPVDDDDDDDDWDL